MKKQPIASSLNRRSFIHGAAVTSAVAGFPAITHSKSPNGKLAIGLIGVGGRGRGHVACLLYTSPSPRDQRGSRMPSSA